MIDTQLMDFLMQMPQASHFTEKNIERFINAVSKDPEHPILWHAGRLAGWGGSEIGTLVANYRGERSTFSAARDLVAQKLLIRMPTEADNLMRRGNLIEPVIAEITRRDYGAVRDERSLNIVKGFHDVDHPWMRSTPDDVLLFGKRRFLVDYKAPTNAPTSPVSSLEYACQVHQGTHLLLQNGITVDGMLVIYYDHSKGEVNPVEIGWDQTVYEDMLAAGDVYWQNVLDKELPPYVQIPVEPLPEYDERSAEAVGDAINHMATLSLAKRHIDAEYEKAVRELTTVATLGGVAPVEALKSLPVVSTTQRSNLDNDIFSEIKQSAGEAAGGFFVDGNNYDGEAMAKALVGMGHPPIYEKKIDKKAVLAYCDEHGIESPYHINTSYSVKPSKKKGISKEDVSEWRGVVGGKLDTAISKAVDELAEDDEQPSETSAKKPKSA